MLWIMNVSKMERTLRGLVRMAQRPDGHGGTLGDDPRLAEAIGRLATDTAAMRCLGYRGFAKATRGEMSPEHMVLKLFTSEAEQRACLLGQEALGLEGLDLDGPGPNRFTEWDLGHFEPARSTRARSARSTTAPGPCSTCVRSPAPSPAGRRRSSATSWPSACSACPGGDRGLTRRSRAGGRRLEFEAVLAHQRAVAALTVLRTPSHRLGLIRTVPRRSPRRADDRWWRHGCRTGAAVGTSTAIAVVIATPSLTGCRPGGVQVFQARHRGRRRRAARLQQRPHNPCVAAPAGPGPAQIVHL